MNESSTWLESTRTLLNNRPKSVSTAQIAQHLGVSKAWVNAFGRGEYSNPGVTTVEKLNVFLKNIAKKVR